MTLDERAAGSFAGDSAGSLAGGSVGSSTILTVNNTFSDVVDEACQKLMDKQVKHSIQRIKAMEQCLTGLEKELDDFLLKKDGKHDEK